MESLFAGLPMPLRIKPARPMTDEELMRFCEQHDELAVEREPNGDLTVMTPAGSGSSFRNSELCGELRNWAQADDRGIVFESSAGFTLPDGSVRAADAAWLSRGKWNALTPEQRESYAPVCPEFIVELRSKTDTLGTLQQKMDQWIANGAELGWLIDPFEKTVHIYRPGNTPKLLDHISQVAGEGPVAGFILPLDRIFTR
jgi:Uma2 family endonuclease